MTAIQATALTFPLLRADVETSALWTNDPSEAIEFARREDGEVRIFDGRAQLDAFVAELSAAILDDGDPIDADAEFLASVGIALPEGTCYDPADFPLAGEAVHPATAAAREALAGTRSLPSRYLDARALRPGVVTIHPPIALSSGQVEEAVQRLNADFPRSRVRTVTESGFTLFVLFAGETA